MHLYKPGEMKKLSYHKPLIKWIDRLSRSMSGELNKSRSPIVGIKSRFHLIGNHNEVSFIAGFFAEKVRKLNVGQSYRNVDFRSKTLHLVIEDLYLHNHNGSTFTCDAKFFFSKGFSKKKEYYHRVFIPISRELYFRFQLQQHGLISDLGYRSSVGSKAVIDHDELFIQVIHDEKNRYFISIHSVQLQSYEVFSNKIFAILVSLGYVTGHMPGNKAYYFSYLNEAMRKPDHIYVHPIRNEIISSYTPVHTNPFAWKSTPGRQADKIYKDRSLQPVSIEVFSNLCQKTHDSLDFSSALLLMLESSVATLLFMPGGYAIALESLADLIVGAEKESLAPVKDKPVSRKLRKALSEVLKTFCDRIDAEGMEVLQGKIDQINQVTNKSRLRRPFEKVGITLSAKDLVLINSRNDFLHGRIPDVTESGIDRTTNRKNLDLFYSAMHFYTLLNMLILKWNGFNGFVLNHPRIHAGYTKIKNKELPYREV